MLVTRGLGATNLVTVGLGASIGTITGASLVGALALSGVVVTDFIAAPVADDPTNAYGRRFLGSFFGPSSKGHN